MVTSRELFVVEVPAVGAVSFLVDVAGKEAVAAAEAAVAIAGGSGVARVVVPKGNSHKNVPEVQY